MSQFAGTRLPARYPRRQSVEPVPGAGRAVTAAVAVGEVDPARTAVLTTVSSDAHTWNLVYLQLLLEEQGWRVVNLGACTPDEVVVGACRTHEPSLLVVSTVNGHGHLDGVRLVRAVRRQPELAALPMIIGGKLGVAGTIDPSRTHALLAAGFSAVFQDGANILSFTAYIASLEPAGRKLSA